MAEGQEQLDSLDIRPLRTLDEFEATIPLQRSIWGFKDEELVASRLFVVFSRIGGSSLGAYLGGNLVGYTLAFAAIKPDGEPFWHSHMAGVVPRAQGSGIGRLLKLRQREEALRAGIDRIEWTFDPLQPRNAHFNIEKLGVEVDTYLPNFYGITSSDLHESIPTDRLVAVWRLRHPAVEARLAGRSRDRARGHLRIEVPARIAGRPRDVAMAIQARVREQFTAAFQAQLRVAGFERTATGGIYHLGRREEDAGQSDERS